MAHVGNANEEGGYKWAAHKKRARGIELNRISKCAVVKHEDSVVEV